MSAAPELAARALACRRGSRRLFAGLGLRVARGQALQVRGANGSGKTSLLRLLAGLALPEDGEVLWRGAPLRGQRERYAAEMAYLGHLAALKDELTPLENLGAELALAGIAADRESLLAALARWGVARQARLPLRALSAGQKRRVALARLTLGDALLWILDEPFNALDAAACDQLGAALEAHLARGGLAVLTSHQPLPLAAARLGTLELAA